MFHKCFLIFGSFRPPVSYTLVSYKIKNMYPNNFRYDIDSISKHLVSLKTHTSHFLTDKTIEGRACIDSLLVSSYNVLSLSFVINSLSENTI